MSTTSDLITAAVLFGPAAVGTAAYAATLRSSRIDSAAVNLVLAESAAARALAAQDTENSTPPPAREPAPEPAAVPTPRLATVIDFPTSRARRAA